VPNALTNAFQSIQSLIPQFSAGLVLALAFFLFVAVMRALGILSCWFGYRRKRGELVVVFGFTERKPKRRVGRCVADCGLPARPTSGTQRSDGSARL
jgi:hypothetical protein